MLKTEEDDGLENWWLKEAATVLEELGGDGSSPKPAGLAAAAGNGVEPKPESATGWVGLL